jgi:hypothetical protein
MRCNFLLTGFVKKNLTKSHKVVMDKLASLGQDGQHDEQHTEQSLDGADETSAVPKPWHESGRDRTYTPVDSNPRFGPDSYLTGPARPDPSQPQSDNDPDLTDPAFHVGHHPSLSTEEPRSQSYSHTNNQPRSNANSAPKLSYREHERMRGYDTAPHLPQFDFVHSSDRRNLEGRSFSYASTTATTPTHYGFQHRTPVLHNPGVQAEFPAVGSPVERSVSTSTQSEDPSLFTAAINARDSLQPNVGANQRMSTDYTWRPGLEPGAFI